MRVNYTSTRKKYQKLALLRNLSGITTCLNITIKQYAIQSGILYVKDLFKDKGQFKTLPDFYNVLRRKSNWLCEYKILKTVIFRTSLRFDMTCCSHIQHILKHEFSFINGLYCFLDHFLRQSSVKKTNEH